MVGPHPADHLFARHVRHAQVGHHDIRKEHGNFTHGMSPGGGGADDRQILGLPDQRAQRFNHQGMVIHQVNCRRCAVASMHGVLDS